MRDDATVSRWGTQGWRQFLTARREILNEYDEARERTKSRKIQVEHGNVAEAKIRSWLSEFLPKKFGVTSGFVVSQNLAFGEAKLSHFDVIIYDALNSPVLWVEKNADDSELGRSRAIPAEYVQGVIEVKVALTKSSARDAIAHLRELKLLMSGRNSPGDRYPAYLPDNFFCECVFFELRASDAVGVEAIEPLASVFDVRGYSGATVLRGEGGDRFDAENTGRFSLYASEEPIGSEIEAGGLFQGMVGTRSTMLPDKKHVGGMLTWRVNNFSSWAFDIIARLHGAWEPGRGSSFHAMSFMKPSKLLDGMSGLDPVAEVDGDERE